MPDTVANSSGPPVDWSPAPSRPGEFSPLELLFSSKEVSRRRAFWRAALETPLIVALAIAAICALLLFFSSLSFAVGAILGVALVWSLPAYLVLGLPTFGAVIRSETSDQEPSASSFIGYGCLANLGSIPLYAALALVAGTDLSDALSFAAMSTIGGFFFGPMNCFVFARRYQRALKLSA